MLPTNSLPEDQSADGSPLSLNVREGVSADATASAKNHRIFPGPSLTMGVYDEILRSLAHGDSIHEAFSLLTQKAQMLTDCTSAAIARLSSDTETLTFLAATGPEAKDLVGSRVLTTDSVLGKTARTGEPYLSYRPVPPGVIGDNAEEVVSAAVLGIFEDGKPIGAIAALNKHHRLPFNSDDLMALTTLAAAASVVLRNSRLKMEASRQSRELSTLYDAVRSVSGKLSIQEVLRAVVEQASAHMENSAVVIFLSNDENTHLYIAEDIGFDSLPEQREVILSAESGLGCAALGKLRPLEITFLDSEELEDRMRGTPTKQTPGTPAAFESPFMPLGARSGISAAIRSGDAVHGFVLVLSGQPPGLYTEADTNLLAALASQAAVAMENAWLYEDANRRAAEAATLYDLSQAVTSTLRLSQVLDRVADAVLTLLNVDKFALFLFDTERGYLRMEMQRGLSAGAADRIRPGIGQGIPGWVMEFETPTAVQDVMADHRNASAPLHPEGVVSLMCMPLQSGISTAGVLCAMNSRRRLFTVAEIELLYTITNQAAIAIKNARVYADVQKKSRELRKYFHRVSRALGSSRTPEAVPQLIASLTQEITEASGCALYSTAEPRTEGTVLIVEASVGLKLSETALPVPGETPAQWIARRGRTLAIVNLDDDNRFRETAPKPLRGKLVSYLGVPLRGQGEAQNVVGVLEIYTRDRREWRAEEIRLLITFASQAAVALRTAQDTKRSEQARRRTETLESLLALAADRVHPPSARQILDHAVTLLDDPVGMIAFRSDASLPESWYPIAAIGVSAVSVREIQERINANDTTVGVTSCDKKTYLYLESAKSVFAAERPTDLLQSVVEMLAYATEKDIGTL